MEDNSDAETELYEEVVANIGYSTPRRSPEHVRDSDQSPSDEPMQHLTGRTETAVTTMFIPIPRSALRDELAINAEEPRTVGVTFLGGSYGSPSNTMSPGLRPTVLPSASGSIQPFGHNTPTLQTDRQDRTGQNRKQSDSIGRTVSQPVAHKLTTHQHT